MHLCWKILLWLSERPRAARNWLLRLSTGLAVLPAIYAVLLAFLHKAAEESLVKAVEVPIPNWYWYVLAMVAAGWASAYITALLQEPNRRTLRRKAAGIAVTLGPFRAREERNRRGPHEPGRIEPHRALVVDLVATIQATRHLTNVTRARAIITDRRGTIIADREIVDRFRGIVNRGDTAEVVLMSVYRPQDNTTQGPNGEGPYKLVGQPEMTPLPQAPGEPPPIIREAMYRVTIELLHAGGLERANFTADLSLDIYEPIKLEQLSALIERWSPPPASPFDTFATP